MNSSDFIARLMELGLPVISTATASSITQKTPAYARLYLHRLHRAGALEFIESGRYCLPGTDDYTIASRIIPDSYITGYAALEHYRLTTQLTTKLEVISTRYHRPLRLSEYTVEFLKAKPEFIYGFAATMNGPVFAEPEKIFVDDLYFHGRQYYSEEFDYAVDSGKVGTEKLADYAKLSGNRALEAKMRALLEEAGHKAPAKHSRERAKA